MLLTANSKNGKRLGQEVLKVIIHIPYMATKLKHRTIMKTKRLPNENFLNRWAIKCKTSKTAITIKQIPTICTT